MRRMRRVFFAAFYIWATITVAGERSARVVDRLERTGSSTFEDLHTPYQSFGEELPNFGHAKKTKANVADISPQFRHFRQVVIQWFEHLPRVEYSSPSFYKVRGSRAPPALI